MNPLDRSPSAHSLSSHTALRVFRVRPGESWSIRTLSAEYGGIFTHYTKERSVYCDPDDCVAGLHRTERFWKGYAAVEVYDQRAAKWLPTVLEITEHLELDFRERFDRGQCWELWRMKETRKKKEPVQGTLLEERDPNTFPPAFDYVPVLLAIYHLERIDLSAKNPRPMKIYLPASEGAPPPATRSRKEAAAVSAEDQAKARQVLDQFKKRLGGPAAKNGSHSV